MDNRLTRDEVDGFLKKGGRKVSRVLSSLGKNRQFLNAVTSPVGKEIMDEVIDQMEAKLELIINEKSSEADRAEYRVLKKIALSWADKINDYMKNIQTVKSSAG